MDERWSQQKSTFQGFANTHHEEAGVKWKCGFNQANVVSLGILLGLLEHASHN